MPISSAYDDLFGSIIDEEEEYKSPVAVVEPEQDGSESSSAYDDLFGGEAIQPVPEMDTVESSSFGEEPTEVSMSIEAEPTEVTPLSDKDVYDGDLLPTGKIAAEAHRLIGGAKKAIAPSVQKTAFLHDKPTERARTARKLKMEAPVHGKAAEELDPTWYRSEKINESIEKIRGEDPNLANAFKMGNISGAADINVYNAYLSGDENAKAQALNTAKIARETGGEFAGKREGRAGITGKATNVLESVSEMLPMIGKSAALSAIPGIGTTLSASMWAKQGAGDIITSLKDEGVDDDTALAYGTIGGIAYSLVEQVQVGRITDVGKKVVGESVKKKLLNLAKKKGLDWIQNVREEVIQGIVTENTIIDAMKASGIEFDPKEVHDRYEKAVKENFTGSAWPMAVLSLAGIGGGAARIGVKAMADKKATVSPAYSDLFEKEQEQPVEPVVTQEVSEVPTEAETTMTPQKVEAATEIKSLQDFDVDEAGFYSLPEEQQNEIFKQLPDEEKDRVLNYEEHSTETVEGVREKVEVEEEAVDTEPTESQKTKGPVEVNPTASDLKRGPELARQISRVKFRGGAWGVKDAATGKILAEPSLQFDDEVSQSTKAIKVSEGINELRKTINDARKEVKDEKPTATAEKRVTETAPSTGGIDREGEVPAKKETKEELKKAGDIVDGLKVRKDIPNTESIESSLSDYKILDGIREVSMDEFELTGKGYSTSENERISDLQEEIGESGEINPLIVVKDAEGYYILEGAHRVDALYNLGKKKIPALVVEDLSEVESEITDEKETRKRAVRPDEAPEREGAIEGEADRIEGEKKKEWARGDLLEEDESRLESETPESLDDIEFDETDEIDIGEARALASMYGTIEDKKGELDREQKLYDVVKRDVFGTIDAKSFGQASDPNFILENKRLFAKKGGKDVDRARMDFISANRDLLQEIGIGEDELETPSDFAEFLREVSTRKRVVELKSEIKEGERELEEYEPQSRPRERPDKKKELKPDEWRQQDLFKEEKSQKQLDEEKSKREEQKEVKRRMEERTGGEAKISGLPLFDDTDIEGSQQTIKLSKGLKSGTQKLDASRKKTEKKRGPIKPSDTFSPPTDKKGSTGEQYNAESVSDVKKNSKADGSKKSSQAKAVENVSKQIQHNPGGEKKGSGWLNVFEYGYFKAKEIAWPIIKMRKVLEKTGVKREKLMNDLDYAIDRVRGAPATAQQYINDHYQPIFDPLKKKSSKEAGKIARTLSQYLVAKRSQWLYNNKAGYEDAGISKQDAESIINYIEDGDYAESKTIIDIAEKIWAYNKTLIDIKHKAGVIDDQLVQNLREPFYVPFYRDIDTGIHVPTSPSKIMFTATGTGIKRIKGSKSGHKIIDPLQLNISSTHEAIVNAERVKVAQNIIKISEAYPDMFGDLISKLPPKWRKAGSIEHRIEVDESLRGQIDDFAKKIGVKVTTKSKLGKDRLGQFNSMAQEIKILYGATESTRAHELGHAIDEKFLWVSKLLSLYKHETGLIADSRYEGEEVPVRFVKYVRRQDERTAEFIALYLSNRPMLKRLAPMAFAEFEKRLKTDKNLKELEKIEPTNVKKMERYEEDNWVMDNSIPSDEDVISFRKEGKLVHYRVPIEMAIAVKNLHPKQIPTWVKWTLAVPTRALRFGAVSGNPDFFVPNVTRDQIDAAHNTKTIPFVDWFIGAKHYITNSDLYKMYQRRGGGMDSPESGISGSKIGMAEIVYGSKAGQFIDPFYWKSRGVLKGATDLSVYALKFPFKPILYLAELSEQGTRLGVFRRDLLSSGIDLNNIKAADSNKAIGHAVHAARQSTLDFQRFGHSGKIPNEIIPFINASLEGLDRFARAWVVPISEGKVPVRPVMYTALIYAIYAALTAWNREDEEYKEVSSREKANNWIVMKGDGTYFKVPKGHITKLVLNSGQMIYETMEGLAKKTGWGIAVDLFGEISPIDQGNILPVTAKLIIEPIANYDFYWKNHIENMSQKSLPPGYRFKKSTSETLKSIGMALNISPIMMQHEVNVALSGTGRNILWLTDWILGASGLQKPPHFDASNAVIVRRFYGKTEEWKTDASDMIREIDKRLNEINKMGVGRLRSMGYGDKEVREAVKASVDEQQKLQNKRKELMAAKKRISSLQKRVKW